ncbi:MAG: RlmE family RNA methyltransferase [Candidatus Heimdallarchaeota archaeon]
MSDDYYYLKAKYKGYRSRASYKIMEINKKFKIFKKGQKILDMCAAPGGWAQICSGEVGISGKVIALDKSYISPFKEKNIEIVSRDIFDNNLCAFLLDTYGEFDVLLSDCSPNISGDYSRDHSTQMYLANRALEVATQILKNEGNFVCKLFQGKESESFTKLTKSLFEKTKLYKPKASRKKSSEIYIIGINKLE